ncbi:GNAT family N-acetyltransferase [Knoellia subterranea]|uniref:GNAT family N-acetyltransferase n=1 Tax=Knoellia subterranea TaxID=184882 RepID=UPI00068DE979|nr:GNAT family N-acetyltransferase [Knoellia subterranea]
MPFPPVVETAHLTLRPPTVSDRDAWVALHRDPRTYWHAPHAMSPTDDDAAEFLESTQKHWDERGFGFWVVEDRATRDVIGVGGLREIQGDPGVHFLNLYYRLVFDRLGQGLGKEISRASAAHALEHLPDLPVQALVKEVNVPSVKTALASGFERVGTRRLNDDLPDEAPSTIFVSPRIESVTSAFDDATREQVLDLWMRTNDAGGAVGFLPGAPRDRVEEALRGHGGRWRVATPSPCCSVPERTRVFWDWPSSCAARTRCSTTRSASVVS